MGPFLYIRTNRFLSQIQLINFVFIFFLILDAPESLLSYFSKKAKSKKIVSVASKIQKKYLEEN
jgi:hypothetical protein